MAKLCHFKAIRSQLADHIPSTSEDCGSDYQCDWLSDEVDEISRVFLVSINSLRDG